MTCVVKTRRCLPRSRPQVLPTWWSTFLVVVVVVSVLVVSVTTVFLCCTAIMEVWKRGEEGGGERRRREVGGGGKKRKEKEKKREMKKDYSQVISSKEERNTHAVFEWTHTRSLFFFLSFAFGVWPSCCLTKRALCSSTHSPLGSLSDSIAIKPHFNSIHTIVIPLPTTDALLHS